MAVAFRFGASAGVCDDAPRAWMGDTVADGAIGVATAGAGVYAITNATTAGASAMGTVGIIAGSSGVIGGVLLAPEVHVGAAAVALIGGGLWRLDATGVRSSLGRPLMPQP